MRTIVDKVIFYNIEFMSFSSAPVMESEWQRLCGRLLYCCITLRQLRFYQSGKIHKLNIVENNLRHCDCIINANMNMYFIDTYIFKFSLLINSF